MFYLVVSNIIPTFVLTKTKTEMKTIKVSEFVTEIRHSRCELYTVIIDNETKKVIKFKWRFIQMFKKGIQDMVDKLIENGMITIFGNKTTEVHINIWDIDETEELYIETYHINPNLPVNELFDNYDRTLKYDKFLML